MGDEEEEDEAAAEDAEGEEETVRVWESATEPPIPASTQFMANKCFIIINIKTDIVVVILLLFLLLFFLY